MSSQGTALRITVEFTNEGLILNLIPIDGEPLEVPSSLTRESLVEQRKSLHRNLEEFKRLLKAGSKVNDWNDISKAVEHLHEKGRVQALDLFGRQLPDVVALFQQACPLWKIDLRLSKLPLPLIEVEASLEDIIPIECLPLLDRAAPKDIDNYPKLDRAMRSFVGFSATVKRTDSRSRKIARSVLENVPKLPVKLFHYASLGGAKEEKEFFTSKNEWIELEGPWPDKVYQDPELFLNNVADHLLKPDLAFSGDIRPFSDQVLHFACHCDTTATESNDYSITLGAEEGGTHKLTMGKLRGRIAEIIENKDELMPLVIFNACGSSTINPAGVTSLPRLFLDTIGNCGFIGTETRIPDEFAAPFSGLFYTALLTGESLGRAIYIARWDMLLRYNNPMGILYTVYADPEIHVRKPN